ncbi:HXXEE domain-containing protein [bacterium]|nr:HXXEE domain-containing protein [bacterium]MBU1918860.1 HXXEE domain-containing protein [bacterium]
MINKLAKNQNWAKATPFLGIIFATVILMNFGLMDPMLYALINIPLYFFHQCEEHFKPGGFKDYINSRINKNAKVKPLNDIKVFWINIILVWFAFLLFGSLAFINIGFGVLIIIFSIINCLTHIVQALRLKEYNPGLIMASIQFTLSLFAAYMITHLSQGNLLAWWLGCLVFSILVHVLLFKLVMTRRNEAQAHVLEKQRAKK